MSPYIFIMSIKIISRYIKKIVKKNRWEPICLRGTNIKISHLMFANDVIFMTKATWRSAQAIKHVVKKMGE